MGTRETVPLINIRCVYITYRFSRFPGFQRKKPRATQQTELSQGSYDKPVLISSGQQNLSKIDWSTAVFMCGKHCVGSPSQWITNHWLLSPIKVIWLGFLPSTRPRIMPICWQRLKGRGASYCPHLPGTPNRHGPELHAATRENRGNWKSKYKEFPRKKCSLQFFIILMYFCHSLLLKKTFKVHTAARIEIVSWDVAPCSLIEFGPRFRGAPSSGRGQWRQ